MHMCEDGAVPLWNQYVVEVFLIEFFCPFIYTFHLVCLREYVAHSTVALYSDDCVIPHHRARFDVK